MEQVETRCARTELNEKPHEVKTCCRVTNLQSMNWMNKHMENKHVMEGLKCDRCGKEVHSMNQLGIHIIENM